MMGACLNIKNGNADGFVFKQPRLHPQGRSHPQIRPQHLPSVLQGEVHGYRIHQGMAHTIIGIARLDGKLTMSRTGKWGFEKGEGGSRSEEVMSVDALSISRRSGRSFHS